MMCATRVQEQRLLRTSDRYNSPSIQQQLPLILTRSIYIASRGTLDPKIRFTEPGTVSVYTPEGDFLHRYNVGIEPCSLLFLKK